MPQRQAAAQRGSLIVADWLKVRRYIANNFGREAGVLGTASLPRRWGSYSTGSRANKQGVQDDCILVLRSSMHYDHNFCGRRWLPCHPLSGGSLMTSQARRRRSRLYYQAEMSSEGPKSILMMTLQLKSSIAWLNFDGKTRGSKSLSVAPFHRPECLKPCRANTESYDAS